MEIVSTGQWQPGDANAVSIEGKPHGAKVTVLLEHMPAGSGPKLHWHPYGETWVVVEGRICFSDGKVTREATNGDIVYVAPEEPHKFTVLSEGRIKMVCIHQSEEFITHWLE
ncbi:MAG TPA: cupin domain-containing protein [Devosia sp.]|nr:cupin domain-containing protein [Devosia sp.]